jgi:hypothetical protein
MSLLWAGTIAFLAAAGSAAAAPHAASCSTHGLGAAHTRVVAVHVQDMSCTRARSLAGRIAKDLATGRPVSVSNAAGFGTSTESCAGCKTTTSVQITFARGSVTVDISGGSGSSSVPGGSGGGTIV